MLRAHLRGHSEIWCAMFDNTIKALAAEVIQLDVQLEKRTDILWLHEWLAARIITDAMSRHLENKILDRARARASAAPESDSGRGAVGGGSESDVVGKVGAGGADLAGGSWEEVG